jgi:hypothetical protein
MRGRAGKGKTGQSGDRRHFGMECNDLNGLHG